MRYEESTTNESPDAIPLTGEELQEASDRLRRSTIYKSFSKGLRFEPSLEEQYLQSKKKKDLDHLAAATVFSWAPIAIWVIAFLLYSFLRGIEIERAFVWDGIKVLTAVVILALITGLVFRLKVKVKWQILDYPSSRFAVHWFVGCCFLLAVLKTMLARGDASLEQALGPSFIVILSYAVIVFQLSRKPFSILAGLMLVWFYLARSGLFFPLSSDQVLKSAPSDVAALVATSAIGFVSAFYTSKNRRMRWLFDRHMEVARIAGESREVEERARRKQSEQHLGL